MENSQEDISAALSAIAAGQLDTLTPEQVARVEAYLNADPEAAARVGALTPRVEESLRQAVAMPPPGAWKRAWEQIEAGGTLRAATVARQRLWRLWGPMLAAAACVLLMVGLWNLKREPAAPAWPIEWAHSVEIDDQEVVQGTMPLVLGGGTDRDISVIWVLDEQG